MSRFYILISCFVLIFKVQAQKAKPVDKKATKETRALYKNLNKLAVNHTLFGHQHATEYGHGWMGDKDRSDVKSVVGSHPAVIGVDISGFTGLSAREIELNKKKLRQNILDTYKRGGVTTIAWHFSNPLSPGGFYWKDSVSVPAVKYLIPGGKDHEKYKEILKSIADWAKSLKADDSTLVPVIFRPFHEFDGDWFWWGRSHCTAEEFKSLWRFTVSYLKDTQQVHNFIYAFSPDSRFRNEQEYLERYPGNEWVDLLGTDNYGDMGRDGYKLDLAVSKLKIVSDLAQKNKKLAAFTETGLESIPDQQWWTNVLLKVMKGNNIRMSYVLVWRNDPKSTTHFYAPYPGQASAEDFKKFYDDPYTLFENDLRDIYKK